MKNSVVDNSCGGHLSRPCAFPLFALHHLTVSMPIANLVLFSEPSHQVTTALPSWNREEDGGSRPASSATEGRSRVASSTTARNNTDTDVGEDHKSKGSTTSTTPSGSRPSSAAFRSWIKARPSALSAVSAVSSARTLGMDDPELVHLQLEMESRRGGMSDATLARVCSRILRVTLAAGQAVGERHELREEWWEGSGGSRLSSARRAGDLYLFVVFFVPDTPIKKHH